MENKLTDLNNYLHSTSVIQQNFSNTIAYRSYRLLVTSQRSLTDVVQYCESQILGYA